MMYPVTIEDDKWIVLMNSTDPTRTRKKVTYEVYQTLIDRTEGAQRKILINELERIKVGNVKSWNRIEGYYQSRLGRFRDITIYMRDGSQTKYTRTKNCYFRDGEAYAYAAYNKARSKEQAEICYDIYAAYKNSNGDIIATNREEPPYGIDLIALKLMLPLRGAMKFTGDMVCKIDESGNRSIPYQSLAGPSKLDDFVLMSMRLDKDDWLECPRFMNTEDVKSRYQRATKGFSEKLIPIWDTNKKVSILASVSSFRDVWDLVGVLPDVEDNAWIYDPVGFKPSCMTFGYYTSRRDSRDAFVTGEEMLHLLQYCCYPARNESDIDKILNLTYNKKLHMHIGLQLALDAELYLRNDIKVLNTYKDVFPLTVKQEATEESENVDKDAVDALLVFGLDENYERPYILGRDQIIYANGKYEDYRWARTATGCPAVLNSLERTDTRLYIQDLKKATGLSAECLHPASNYIALIGKLRSTISSNHVQGTGSKLFRQWPGAFVGVDARNINSVQKALISNASSLNAFIRVYLPVGDLTNIEIKKLLGVLAYHNLTTASSSYIFDLNASYDELEDGQEISKEDSLYEIASEVRDKTYVYAVELLHDNDDQAKARRMRNTFVLELIQQAIISAWGKAKTIKIKKAFFQTSEEMAVEIQRNPCFCSIGNTVIKNKSGSEKAEIVMVTDTPFPSLYRCSHWLLWLAQNVNELFAYELGDTDASLRELGNCLEKLYGAICDAEIYKEWQNSAWHVMSTRLYKAYRCKGMKGKTIDMPDTPLPEKIAQEYENLKGFLRESGGLYE